MRAMLAVIVLLTGVAAAPVIAQDAKVLDLRVGKLEKEMKAVQRKIFPAGAPVEAELTTGPAASTGTPATTPISDLTARIDALESQLKSLTGQVEQDGFRIKKQEDAMKALEARIKALEPVPEPATVPTGTGSIDAPATPLAATPAVATTPAPKPVLVAKPVTPAPAKPAAAAKVDPKRKALVDAVEIPATADPIEDAYTYGFRLWSAKLYPEAQVKLKEFVAKNPSHKRASYAQNLLGRAYLDEGKPALASVAFYDNYQKMPRGERAAESLYWLGHSMTKLKKLADACKVYKEFDDVYAPRASADLKAKVAKGRVDANCPA